MADDDRIKIASGGFDRPLGAYGPTWEEIGDWIKSFFSRPGRKPNPNVFDDPEFREEHPEVDWDTVRDRALEAKRASHENDPDAEGVEGVFDSAFAHGPLSDAFDMPFNSEGMGRPGVEAEDIMGMGDIEYDSEDEMNRELSDLPDYEAEEPTPVHFEYSERTRNVEAPEIKTVQQLLVDLKYDIGPDGVDGFFGEDTANALAQFYRDRDKDRDGTVIDESTFTELISARR